METLLKEVENDIGETAIYGYSLIAYVATLSEDTITCNEIECASKIMHYAISNTFHNDIDVITKLLIENDKQNFITLLKDNAVLIINVQSKWLFQVILINATRYLSILNTNVSINEHSSSFLQNIVAYINKYTLIDNRGSVHLLRTLLQILTRRIDIFEADTCSVILENMGKVALSPVTYFRQYAYNISKIVLPASSRQVQNMFCNISLLPIRGIDTTIIVKLLQRDFIKENMKTIIKKVLKLFLNNVENKDGGLLYESVLFYTFEEWKINVWPLFLHSLTSLEHEGEFFQSLRKYWIPANVMTYRSDFYLFLKKQNVDKKFKAYVLLESKKRGFIEGISVKDVLSTIRDIETSSIGLRIISVCHKKSLFPEKSEHSAILHYLYSILNTSLIDDEVDSLKLYFSQLFLHAHLDLKRTKENVSCYYGFLEDIYKYCMDCLKTDRYEIAAQVLLIVTNISIGSNKCLKLHYKVEKKDMYENGENLLYNELKNRKFWIIGSEEFCQELKTCFIRNRGNGSNLAKLLVLYGDSIDFFDVQHLTCIISTNTTTTLQNTEKIKNYVHIICEKKKLEPYVCVFLGELKQNLSDNLISTRDKYSSENILYQNALFFEIILLLSNNNFQVHNLHEEIEKALDLIGYILENNFSGNGNYKTGKILEAFINSVMYCMIQNKDMLWKNIDKRKVLFDLIRIIQRSNMKRPVSLAAEVLKHLSVKMEHADSDRELKIEILEETLNSIYRNPVKQELKIRRSPESRLVIHALCSSERNDTKPLLNWTLDFLLNVASSSNSSDSTLSSALHTIEILVSDNSLHTDTVQYLPDIIMKCVELFSRTSWVVRNADLQLAKALIERFYGVLLSPHNRPKNIQDLFLLYPQIMIYFYKILTLENLDERSILVFQFFFESHFREQLFDHEITKIGRESFLAVFSDIIKKYTNNYGKLAVRSYVSICPNKEIPDVVVDIADYIKSNFSTMKKNVFSNFVFLLQELCEKYRNSFGWKDSFKINFAVDGLLRQLRKYNTGLFDFLLFKIKSVHIVLKEFELLNNCNDCDYKKRIWLHNNIPFLITNTKSSCISDILNRILKIDLPGYIQVKILSILVQRIENSCYTDENLCDMLSVLFKKSLLVENFDEYVIICYFKTILYIICNVKTPVVKNTVLNFKLTDHLYKIMIYVLYFSIQKCDDQEFYSIAKFKYIDSIGINDDIDCDIMSTLCYFMKGCSKETYPTIFKLALYSSIRSSTYLKAFNFITYIMKKSYSGLLTALGDFLDINNLLTYFGDKEILEDFYKDLDLFIDTLPEIIEENGEYYSVESDCVLSKVTLKKLLRSVL